MNKTKLLLTLIFGDSTFCWFNFASIDNRILRGLDLDCLVIEDIILVQTFWWCYTNKFEWDEKSNIVHEIFRFPYPSAFRW